MHVSSLKCSTIAMACCFPIWVFSRISQLSHLLLCVYIFFLPLLLLGCLPRFTSTTDGDGTSGSNREGVTDCPPLLLALSHMSIACSWWKGHECRPFHGGHRWEVSLGNYVNILKIFLQCLRAWGCAESCQFTGIGLCSRKQPYIVTTLHWGLCNWLSKKRSGWWFHLDSMPC